eukprot:6956433-Pyramimonas_sp.AAC.1
MPMLYSCSKARGTIEGGDVATSRDVSKWKFAHGTGGEMVRAIRLRLVFEEFMNAGSLKNCLVLCAEGRSDSWL